MPRKSDAEKQREDTERIAFELYHNRMLLGKPGDEHSDWAKADQIVRSPIRTTLFASNRRLIKLEKKLWEPILAWANDQAILSLLGLIGNLGLIIAVATYIGSEKQRRDAEVLNAWQTITSAYDQSGSGGRIQALEFLNASPGANWRRKFPWFCAPLALCVWEAENLAGINLTVSDEDGGGVYLGSANLQGAFLGSANLERAVLDGANLQEAFLGSANLERAVLDDANLQEAVLDGAILQWAFLGSANLQEAILRGANLQRASLYRANLERAVLWSANLQEAVLEDANLQEAALWNANLQRAVLRGANLQRAVLDGANLQKAVLDNANLQGAELRYANLQEAVLDGAILQGAVLEYANLQGANLRNVNLEGAVLVSANLQRSWELARDQLTLAKLCRTTLPESFTLDPNRDCEELGIDPKTGRSRE